MLKNKKNFIYIIFAIILVAYCIRVYAINTSVSPPAEKVYKCGDIASFGSDFIYSSEHKIEGYRIQTLGCKIYTREEFIEKYRKDVEKDLLVYDYYITADVKIYNDNTVENEKSGISLLYMPLTSINDNIMCDEDATLFANPTLPGVSFSLRPSSNMDVTIVYPLSKSNYKSVGKIDSTDFSIRISNYPTRKLIKIK